MFTHEEYDVIVAGAGPAGCATATLVAEGGHRVLLLEREPAPRFKVGESLMPSTYWTFERLGVLDQLKESDFPKKYSVQFFSKRGKGSAPFYFFEDDPHESSTTWQVLRQDFDRMLFDNAAAKGAECHRGVKVKEVLFEGERARGVRVEGRDGREHELSCRVVVDATGQSALLARKLGLRRLDPRLDKASIFTHFRGAKRDPGIDEGATLILHTTEADSWFWYIPLPDDVVSVGVVGSVEYLIGQRDSVPAKTFEEEVEKCEEVKRRLEGAERVRDFHVLKDFSYGSKRAAGPGWVLVGDAFSFIDPVYSSGVLLALKSGEMAADAICDALERDDLSGEALGRFGPELEKGMEAIRGLVYAFYSKDFSFARFLKEHPEHKKDVVDILVGKVFRRDFSELFAAMREMREMGDRRETEAGMSRGA